MHRFAHTNHPSRSSARAALAAALLAVSLVAAGCGGSGGSVQASGRTAPSGGAQTTAAVPSGSTSTATAPTPNRRTRASAPHRSAGGSYVPPPLPKSKVHRRHGGRQGNAPVPKHRPDPLAPPAVPQATSYLRGVWDRAHFEVFLSSVARARSSSPAVRRFAQRILRDRSREIAELTYIARRDRLRLSYPRPTVQQTGQIRDLIRRSGRASDAAYLRIERALIEQAIAGAQAARSSGPASFQTWMARVLSGYRSELATAQSL